MSRKLVDGSYELVARTKPIAMGDHQLLTVDLQPGEYQLSCDIVEEVGGKAVSHTVQGMVTNITVR